MKRQTTKFKIKIRKWIEQALKMLSKNKLTKICLTNVLAKHKTIIKYDKSIRMATIK